jgi:hypothetical protein
MKKLNLKAVVTVFCVMAVTAFGAVSAFKEYLPIDQKTDAIVQKWDALLALFTQKAGDTMTGDLEFALNKGPVIKAGTASAQGRAGTIAFQTGVLEVISNSTVTANTRTFITKASTTAPLANTFIVTNQVGIGVAVIPSTACTNTLNYFMIETN